MCNSLIGKADNQNMPKTTQNILSLTFDEVHHFYECIEECFFPYETKVEEVDMNDDKPTKKKKETLQWKLAGGNALAMSAIATQIALGNVTVVLNTLRFISQKVDSLKDMIYTGDKKLMNSSYTMGLCMFVMDHKNEPLWNNSSIVNYDMMNKVTPVIVFRKARIYSGN